MVRKGSQPGFSHEESDSFLREVDARQEELEGRQEELEPLIEKREAAAKARGERKLRRRRLFGLLPL